MKKSTLFFTTVLLQIFAAITLSAQNPSLVADVNATGNEPNVQEGSVISNGILYFVAGNTIDGLWRTDGTQAGTYLVKNFTSDNYYGVNNLTDVNGTLFFSAQIDGDGFGQELWKSDGTENGTVRVKDINPGPESSYLYRFNNVNGILFFTAFEPVHGSELWRSDG